MIRKTMAERDARKPEQREAPVRRSPRPEPMHAPRPGAWEPIPLHVPQPEPPRRESGRASESETPRGVVIINYGDE